MKSLISILSSFLLTGCSISSRSFESFGTWSVAVVLIVVGLLFVALYVADIMMKNQRKKVAVTSFDQAIVKYHALKNDFGALAKIYFDQAYTDASKRMLDEIQAKLEEMDALIKVMQEHMTENPDLTLRTYMQFILIRKFVADQMKIAEHEMKTHA